jgi:hypothetical protein
MKHLLAALAAFALSSLSVGRTMLPAPTQETCNDIPSCVCAISGLDTLESGTGTPPGCFLDITWEAMGGDSAPHDWENGCCNWGAGCGSKPCRYHLKITARANSGQSCSWTLRGQGVVNQTGSGETFTPAVNAQSLACLESRDYVLGAGGVILETLTVKCKSCLWANENEL